MYYTLSYMHTNTLHFAVLATDTVAFRVHDNSLEVLLIKVSIPEFTGMEGLPGGLIDPKETAEESATRHLLEKGGVSSKYIEQLYTFSDITRDPRGRVVSVAYMSLVPPILTGVTGDARWCAVQKLPTLAYDHTEIVQTAIERLRAKVEYTTIIQKLMPHEFTFTELQQAYETVLGRDLDKRNFRKKFLALSLLQKTGNKRTEEAFRPAELYSFTNNQVETIEIL